MIVEEYAFTTVRKHLLAALSELKFEPKLFSIRINERTLTQRLSLKLQSFFEGKLSVDCEYNRMWDGGDMRKRLPRPDRTWTDDDEGRTVFPDIIVHVRDEPFENLLVIEAKRNHSGKKLPLNDEEKLTLFTDPHGDFQYRWGAFINFMTAAKKKQAVVVWFSSDGKETGRKDVVPLSGQIGGAA